MVHITISIIAIIILIAVIALILGFTQVFVGPRTTIKSPAEAGEKTIDIGSGTEAISSSLTEILRKLG